MFYCDSVVKKGRRSVVVVWCTGKGRRSIVIVWRAGKGRHSIVTVWCTGKGRCSIVIVWCTGKGRCSIVIVWCTGKGRRSIVIVWCVSSCVEERQLRQRIRELTRYRKNGVTKEEGRVFARTHTHIFHRLIPINHSVVVLCSC